MKDYNAIEWGNLVCYDETSPTFLRWKVDRCTGKDSQILLKAAGDIAGCIHTTGYSVTKFKSIGYLNHRIIWCLFYGEIDPDLIVDHQDGNPTNNHIYNLRMVSQIANLRNQILYHNNKTGVVGVRLYDNGFSTYYAASWYSLSGKRKTKYFSITKLGESEAFRLACECRTRMIEELNMDGAGYTERHGT